MADTNYLSVQRMIIFCATAASALAFGERAVGATPSKDTFTQAQEPLVVWHMLDANLAKVLGDIVTKWSEKTGMPVVLETGFDMATALLKVRAAKRYPDAIIAPLDVINLDPHVPFMVIPAQARDPNVVLSASTRGVSTFNRNLEERVIPLFLGNHLMLLHNKSRARKAISKIEQIPAGSNDLAFDLNAPYLLLPFLLGRSRDRSAYETRQSPLRTEDFAAALADLSALRQAGIVPHSCDYACPEKRLRDGTSTYAIVGDWALPDLLSQMGNNLGVAALPSWRGHQMVAASLPIVMAFPGATGRLDLPKIRAPVKERKVTALIKLAVHLQSYETQKTLGEATYRFAAHKKVLGETLESGQSLRRTVWHRLLESSTLPAWIDAVFWSVLRQAMEQTKSGRLTPELAATMLEELRSSKDYLALPVVSQ